MSSRSIDPVGVGGTDVRSSSPSFGQTLAYALLTSRLWLVLIAAVLVLCYIFRDQVGGVMGSAWSSMAAALVVLALLSPAAVLGWFFGRFVHFNYILRNGVIVVVEPVEGGASCYRMTDEAFSAAIPADVPFTPFSTSSGEPYYIVKGFDEAGKLIPGDVHSEGEDFVRLMAYRNSFNGWLSDYHKAVDRSVELELVPFREGQDYARDVVRQALVFESFRRGMSSAGRKVSEDPQNLTVEDPERSSVQEGSDGRR